MITLAFDGKHQTFSKAARTGETYREITRIAKEAKRSREAAPVNDQMTLLPGDTEVPF